MWGRQQRPRTLAFTAVTSFRRPLRQAPRCSGKGFGKQVAPPNREKKTKGKAIAERKKQPITEPNELLKEFMRGGDLEKTAADNAAGLTEEFFVMADAFLKMAERDGETSVIKTLQATIKAAMKVKNQSLRPEIRLVNQLLMATTTAEQRKEILDSPETLEVLQLNDGYFFTLVDFMIQDASSQPDNDDRQEIIRQLKEIKQIGLEKVAQA